MNNELSELTMLLIYLTGWEETPKTSKKDKKVFRAWVFHKVEILHELQNQGLIRLTPGGKYITVTEKGKQIAGELKKQLLDKTNDQFLKGLEIKPWTKSLLPCHIPKDDNRYAQYLDLMELMQIPEIEFIILGKMGELKVVAKDYINQFFDSMK